MKLQDIGLLSKNIQFAQITCDCEDPDCNPIIMGSNFETKEEVINFALSFCDEWECNHTFAFVKFKDNTCAIAFHEIIKQYEVEKDTYEWSVYKIKWSKVKEIRKYIAEFTEIHFAAVLEENEDGDFEFIVK